MDPGTLWDDASDARRRRAWDRLEVVMRIGVDLNFDGLHYGTYDASAYDGILFWARGTPLIWKPG